MYTAKSDRVFDGDGDVLAECYGANAEATAKAIADALNRPPVVYVATVEWASYDCGGANVETIQADTLEDAAAKAVALVADDTYAITVLAVVGQAVVDVVAEKQRRVNVAQEARDAAHREEQRKEYERLRLMFEPSVVEAHTPEWIAG